MIGVGVAAVAAACRRQPSFPPDARRRPANAASAAPCPRPPLAAGYGVYGSEEECMASEAVIEATGINPSTYPSPSFPPTACPARSRATGSVSGPCSR